MIKDILIAVAVLGSLSVFLGVLIVIINKLFEVKLDPMVEELIEILPGANCGACGYPGCEQFAVELAKRGDASLMCPVGKDEVANKIKELVKKYKSEAANE